MLSKSLFIVFSLFPRSDNIVRVHGRSSERRVVDEHAQTGHQRDRLGQPEQLEKVLTLSPIVGTLPTFI